MISADVAILIYSMGREVMLSQLIADMDAAFMPALEAGGVTACTFVYAQQYSAAYIAALRQRHAKAIAAGRLLIVEAPRLHSTIGEVFVAAGEAMHTHVEYKLAMLMDDDSRYRAGQPSDENLRQSAQQFLHQDARCYSIKLGTNDVLEYAPFIDLSGPIMPFKEKMIWVSKAVMDEALSFPALPTLEVGEDVVLTALAWRGDASKCRAVFGIANFRHLAFEPDPDHAGGPINGGYGQLVSYDEAGNADPELGKYGKAFRGGVVPHTVLPDIFVGADHPHHTISGIKPEAVARYAAPLAAVDLHTPRRA